MELPVIASAVSIAKNSWDMGRGIFRWLRSFPVQVLQRNDRPPDLILFLASRPHAATWSVGMIDGKPCMSIHIHLRVTNRTEQQIQIMRATIDLPLVMTVNYFVSGALIAREPSPAAPIFPNSVGGVEMSIVALGHPYEKGEPFLAKVTLVDQFNASYDLTVTVEGT